MKRDSGRIERRPGIIREEPAASIRRECCFALDVNWRPVLAFSATSLRSASARVREPWFVEELERMRSNGRSIMRPSDMRMVRPAGPDEIAALELQRGLDETRGEDLKYCFAFLVEIDAELN
jgi:hypothetical protein